ncbi:MAG: type VI secretion system contractile sheath large subunit, partial [Gammaproteobacteria bacterium]|nr:type VI secretion system contractile sheath large subunit [Gammaproteobacteria bacterium]
MSTEEQAAEAVVEEAESVSLLEQAITATKQTPKDETEDLLKELTKQALGGTVSWNKNLSVTINSAINQIDEIMSKQL